VNASIFLKQLRPLSTQGLIGACLLVGSIPLTAEATKFDSTDQLTGEAHKIHKPHDEKYPTSDYLTGNWGGARERLHDKGLDILFHYTTEPMYNVSGGEETGGTYLHNIGLDFKFDLDKIFGGGNTTLLIKFAQRYGDSVSADYVAPSEGGNTFTVQEIFGGQTYKLANLQFNTLLMEDRLDLAYGRLIANDDFLRSDLYCQFVNNSFCGSPKPVFLQDPFTFSAYPTAQWGARARYDTQSRDWTFQGAIYDGDPELKRGDPASSGHNEHGWNMSFGNNGVVLAGEAHYHINRDSDTELPGVYKIGGYYMSGDFRDISQTDNSTVSGNAMLWLLVDQMLFRKSPGSKHGLSMFGTLVFSLDDDINQMDNYFSLGLIYNGPFDARPRDAIGLAVTTGWYSDELNTARDSEELTDKSYEAVIELNYKFVLERGISISPVLQYVIRPAGTGDIDNSLLLGAKLSIMF
jgi:porin